MTFFDSISDASITGLPEGRGLMQVMSAGEAFIRLLGERGIDCFFANAGTDFPPIIEGLAKAASLNLKVPRPITVPHENVAVAMAIGHWLVSRRVQAVMTHVNVGTANAICNLLNASRGNIPILFCSGRTPYTEKDRLGSRNLHIHWGQEMFDQAGMLREIVKWEYELRDPCQLETVVDRALAIANTEPKGPVYISLPREVLASPLDSFEYAEPSRLPAAAVPRPGEDAVRKAADILTEARSPLIITTALGLGAGATAALERFVAEFAIPVIQYVPRCVSLRTSNPMHAGYDPLPWLRTADAILVLDCAVPWIPAAVKLAADVRVIQGGIDPLHADIPIRGFACDIAIAGESRSLLSELGDLLRDRTGRLKSGIAERREAVANFRKSEQERRSALLRAAAQQTPISPVWFTHCISAVLDDQTILMREAPQLAPSFLELEHEHAFFNLGAAGGLGWGLGAAVGAKLADPTKTVVAIEGDGSYMFNVPVAAHYVALEQEAPFLTVIMNNRRWHEVRAATTHIYPGGQVATGNVREPLTHFHPGLQLAKIVEAVGGYGEQVTDPQLLPPALQNAIRIVREEKRQVVLDVICA